MAEEQSDDQPSLELPSLFTRGREDAPPPVELVEIPPAETSAPRVPPLLAGAMTGALVGLVTTGLVWLALRGCSALRGTSSCGDPGILVLLAIFVAMVLGGRGLLAALHVADAGSTALLGMALLAVVALLFVGDLDSALGAAVLAVVGAGVFALAQWVTANFTEPGERAR
jgi:hypothetical protein